MIEGRVWPRCSSEAVHPQSAEKSTYQYDPRSFAFSADAIAFDRCSINLS